MTTIHLDDFMMFLPQPKNDLRISITNTKKININAKMMESMPSHIQLGVSKVGNRLLVVESDDTGFKIPKSGMVAASHIIEHVIASGVQLPAYYTMTKEENAWVGQLKAQEPIVFNAKKKPLKKNVLSLEQRRREGKCVK